MRFFGTHRCWPLGGQPAQVGAAAPEEKVRGRSRHPRAEDTVDRLLADEHTPFSRHGQSRMANDRCVSRTPKRLLGMIQKGW